jgi:hypothetical protein
VAAGMMMPPEFGFGQLTVSLCAAKKKQTNKQKLFIYHLLIFGLCCAKPRALQPEMFSLFPNAGMGYAGMMPGLTAPAGHGILLVNHLSPVR